MNMSRFAPYLGIVAALVVAALFIIFSGTVTVLRPPATLPVASSTLSAVPGIVLPPLLLPSRPLEGPLATATLQKQTTPQAPKPLAPPASTPATTSPQTVAPASSAVALRKALVNIICFVSGNNHLTSISGTGVIVDPKGVILTNAHVAQYFLLADRGVSCTIRTGSPAADKYKAALMYLSPPWLRANSNVLTEAAPTGTGEFDFAFLAVTVSATSTPLPSFYYHVPLAKESFVTNAHVAIASYGAQFLQPNQIRSSLFPTIVFSAIKNVFTFATDTVDILSFDGSAAAQEGSSGGGVINDQGELIGVLTTSTLGADASTRVLHAITASYIRAEYERETGQSLSSLLAGSPAAAAINFAPQMPALESLLTAHLP